MSGRQLGTVLGKSEGYIRSRVADEHDFTLTDIERFCDMLGVMPDTWIAGIEDANVTPIRSVRRAPQDDQKAVARPESMDSGEDGGYE